MGSESEDRSGSSETRGAGGSHFWRRATWGLIVGVAVVRVVFLVLLSPYELTGDEAHYWEWSRRPAMSYYSKGPGVAWTIGAARAVLGDSEWAVRMPSVVFGAVGAAAVAGLARRMTRERATGNRHQATGDALLAERVGFVAAALFCLAPAYLATGLIMTIDGPYIACWAVAALLGWMAIVEKRRWALVACAAVLGVGFLFKYTILLLVPGLIGAWWWERRFAKESEKRKAKSENQEGARGGTSARPTSLAVAPVVFVVAVVVFACVVSPVVIWNFQNDWPTVKHLLGHVGAAGGDQAHEAKKAWRWDPMWTLEFVGTQLAMMGPMVVLMVMGCISPRRAPVAAGRLRGTEEDRDSVSGTGCVATTSPWFSVSSVVNGFGVCCAVPIVGFYLLTTLATDVEGNWPIAGYVTLLPLAAMVVVRECARLRATGSTRSAVRGWWRAAVVYGVIAGTGMMGLGWLKDAPVVGKYLPTWRLSGKKAFAARVAELMEENPGAFVVASRYDTASLLAYYLPGHPSVRSATSAMGGRRSSYDFFADTRLDDAGIMGSPAVMVGGDERKWSRAMVFDSVRVIEEETREHPALRVGVGYRGLAGGDADQR